MIKNIPTIAHQTYYVGVNDREKHLFENLWPLESGIAYNSYLINDKKTALIDTVDSNAIDEFLQKIQMILNGRPLDYLIINHMEPDHCSGITHIKRLYPNVEIVGNKKTFEFLNAFYGVTDNLYEVKEGDELQLGDRSLKFIFAPMVHWPEVMMAYDTKEHTLFSADAFGCFGTLDGGITDEQLNMDYYWEDFIRYYSNVVGKFGGPVQKVLCKCALLSIKTIAATHGPIWKSAENIKKILGLYDKWSKYETEPGVVICFGSMYGRTEAMAEAIARSLSENGVKNIRIFDVSKTHASYIIKEIFKYKGLIVGSSTYNSGLHPNVESLMLKLKNMNIKNHYFGVFGSFSWSGEATKNLYDICQQMNWDIVAPAIKQKGAIDDLIHDECVSLAEIMAKKVL
ncbi:MAG: FprA family A-type flavoprotein [Bacteroidales bacterium]|nr:FprA family A-type flavoprotein [Bacteroidales bacterium]